MFHLPRVFYSRSDSITRDDSVMSQSPTIVQSIDRFPTSSSFVNNNSTSLNIDQASHELYVASEVDSATDDDEEQKQSLPSSSSNSHQSPLQHPRNYLLPPSSSFLSPPSMQRTASMLSSSSSTSSHSSLTHPSTDHHTRSKHHHRETYVTLAVETFNRFIRADDRQHIKPTRGDSGGRLGMAAKRRTKKEAGKTRESATVANQATMDSIKPSFIQLKDADCFDFKVAMKGRNHAGNQVC